MPTALAWCSVRSLALGLSIALLAHVRDSFADDKLEPGDPIAAIDGEPVYLGELNLILTERFKTRDLDALGLDIQRATATLLVQRHLAMKTLETQGGDVLQGMIRRQLESFAAEAKRRGSSIQEQAKARLADENSLSADLAWRVAWGQYLKSKLNRREPAPLLRGSKADLWWKPLRRVSDFCQGRHA